MRVHRRNRALLVALWINAALMGMILIAVLSRSSGPSLLPAAFAQQQPAIAGGGGIFVMPCQTGPTRFGCYLLDIDNQTLCVYEYTGGDHQLRLLAARDYRYDRRLKRFNTDQPSPSEVKAMVEKEQANK